MEIHAPEGPTHSLRDFAVHIIIVTIGILIALGLDGFKETLHEHRLMAEARESFKQELEFNQDHLNLDHKNVKDMAAVIDKLLADVPSLAARPADLTARVLQIQPQFYFFSTTSWDAAIASGALTHMTTRDVHDYSNYYQSARHYQDAQKELIPMWIQTTSFFRSHTTFTAVDIILGQEKLLNLGTGIRMLDHLADEFDDGIKQAVKTSQP
jgi:hypothetical protein